MISYGFLWFLMISYDFVWFLMISYDFLWFLMISYDFVWFLMIHFFVFFKERIQTSNSDLRHNWRPFAAQQHLAPGKIIDTQTHKDEKSWKSPNTWKSTTLPLCPLFLCIHATSLVQRNSKCQHLLGLLCHRSLLLAIHGSVGLSCSGGEEPCWGRSPLGISKESIRDRGDIWSVL